MKFTKIRCVPDDEFSRLIDVNRMTFEKMCEILSKDESVKKDHV